MIAPKLSIYFHYLVEPFYFPARGQLKTFLLTIFKKHSKNIQTINFIFCSDEYLLELNKKHLKHNFYTDIITFELNDRGQPLLADVYISIERVRDNAKQFKVSLQNEILRLLIHGTLHLCGYRDKNCKEIDEMRTQEGLYINKYSFHVKRLN